MLRCNGRIRWEALAPQTIVAGQANVPGIRIRPSVLAQWRGGSNRQRLPLHCLGRIAPQALCNRGGCNIETDRLSAMLKHDVDALAHPGTNWEAGELFARSPRLGIIGHVQILAQLVRLLPPITLFLFQTCGCECQLVWGCLHMCTTVLLYQKSVSIPLQPEFRPESGMRHDQNLGCGTSGWPIYPAIGVWGAQSFGVYGDPPLTNLDPKFG
jgi:hypothetical protein